MVPFGHLHHHPQHHVPRSLDPRSPWSPLGVAILAHLRLWPLSTQYALSLASSGSVRLIGRITLCTQGTGVVLDEDACYTFERTVGACASSGD